MKTGFLLPWIGIPQLLGTAVLLATPAMAADPLKIGVIAEAQAIAGASIPQAAQMAADEINAKGGVDGRKIEIISYDNHSSSADSVRAFQRAVNEDKVNTVIAQRGGAGAGAVGFAPEDAVRDARRRIKRNQQERPQ
jgi:branched-chain amino acid transport system substrate-binding protein